MKQLFSLLITFLIATTNIYASGQPLAGRSTRGMEKMPSSFSSHRYTPLKPQNLPSTLTEQEEPNEHQPIIYGLIRGGKKYRDKQVACLALLDQIETLNQIGCTLVGHTEDTNNDSAFQRDSITRTFNMTNLLIIEASLEEALTHLQEQLPQKCAGVLEKFYEKSPGHLLPFDIMLLIGTSSQDDTTHQPAIIAALKAMQRSPRKKLRRQVSFSGGDSVVIFDEEESVDKIPTNLQYIEV